MDKFLIDSEGKKRSATEINCSFCDRSFLRQTRHVNKINNFCTKDCFTQFRTKNTTKVILELKCDYCHSSFERRASSLTNSKSGLVFCCREHKDLAQKIENGFVELWPSHYNTGKQLDSYRRIAFSYYENKCNICSNRDKLVLEVHHKDRDRSNNSVDNLEILCANCHTKRHKLKL